MLQKQRRTIGKPVLCLGIVVLLATFGRVGGTEAQVTGPAPVPPAATFAVLGNSNVPGAGTTPITGPGGGTPTGPVRPTLPRTGAGNGRKAAAAGGLALIGFGLTLVVVRHRMNSIARRA